MEIYVVLESGTQKISSFAIDSRHANDHGHKLCRWFVDKCCRHLSKKIRSINANRRFCKPQTKLETISRSTLTHDARRKYCGEGPAVNAWSNVIQATRPAGKSTWCVRLSYPLLKLLSIYSVVTTRVPIVTHWYHFGLKSTHRTSTYMLYCCTGPKKEQLCQETAIFRAVSQGFTFSDTKLGVLRLDGRPSYIMSRRVASVTGKISRLMWPSVKGQIYRLLTYKAFAVKASLVKESPEQRNTSKLRE